MNIAKKFLLVDDHRLFLEGMRYMLERLEGEVEVDTADSVAGALHLFESGKQYDLLLLDLSLPELDGFSLIKSLDQRSIILPIVIVSSTSEIADIRLGLQMGASGFIHKNASSDEMLSAVKRVLAGELVLPDTLSSQLQVALRNDDQQFLTPEPEQGIGSRQLEVLKLIDEGMSNKQIAKILAISEATVKYHIGILFKHLGAKNRTSCLLKAREKNYLSL